MSDEHKKRDISYHFKRCNESVMMMRKKDVLLWRRHTQSLTIDQKLMNEIYQKGEDGLELLDTAASAQLACDMHGAFENLRKVFRRYHWDLCLHKLKKVAKLLPAPLCSMTFSAKALHSTKRQPHACKLLSQNILFLDNAARHCDINRAYIVCTSKKQTLC